MFTLRAVPLGAFIFAMLPVAAILTLAPTVAATEFVTHTYDEPIGQWTEVGTFYPGFTYSGDNRVDCANDLDYTASTQPCAVHSWNGFTITADGPSMSFIRYEADVAGYGVTFTGFDASGNQVATTSCATVNVRWENTHCVLVSPVPMQSVTVTGTYASWPRTYVDTSIFTLNAPPTACFQHVELDLATRVVGACSSDLDGAVTSWTWDWGDGSPAESDTIMSHAYASVGRYAITLTVTDNGGAWSRVSQIVTVPGPNAGFGISSQSASRTIPSLSTSPVSSRGFTTPPVETPPTCMLDVCTSPTTIPAQSTPSVAHCDPTSTLCIDQGPVPLTPEETAPALCDTALSSACLGPVQVLEPQTVPTPEQESRTLTPPVTLSVSTADFVLGLQPNVGEFSTIPPATVGPFTLCPEPPSQICQSAPVAPSAMLVGSIMVYARAGDTTVERTITLP